MSTAGAPPDPDPPTNLEAERSALGSMLFGDETIAKVRAIVTSDDFWRDAHRDICKTIFAMHAEGVPVDAVTLGEWLTRSGLYKRVGGERQIVELLTAVPHGANAEYYADIVRVKSFHRALLTFALDMSNEACNPTGTPAQQFANMESRVAQIKHRAERVGGAGPATVGLDTIKTKPVAWVWPGRIPSGKVTVVAGPGGVGKTLASLSISAKVSRGDPWPDLAGECAELGSILLICGEDDLEDTVRPRAEAAGADLEKLRLLPTAERTRFALADIRTLERVADETPDLRLIVIDPPTSHLGIANENSNAEMRKLLVPLAEFAARREVAIVLITHLGKAKTEKAANRILGSVAWLNVPRAGWIIRPDKADEDRRVMAHIKMNLAPRPTSLGFRIDDKIRVVWESESRNENADDPDDDEHRGRRGGKAEHAGEWLEELLAAGPRLQKEVFALGDAAGFGRDTLYKARVANEDRIKAKKFGYQGVWYWGLGDPRDWVFDRPAEPSNGVPF